MLPLVKRLVAPLALLLGAAPTAADKVGDDVERDVYIVGKTQDGQWAGLETKVVET